MANKDIIQELNDLGSSLGKTDVPQSYTVPQNYFENFADRVLDIVKGENSLSWLPASTPFRVPAGYFEAFPEKILQAVRPQPDFQTSEAEIEELSPLLSSLRKRPVYTVPTGYFENFNVAVQKTETVARVVSMAGRRWVRYAAAAIVVAAVTLAGLFVYRNNHRDPARSTLARFEREVKKIDDVKKTDSLIEDMDAGLNQRELASNQRTAKVDDVQQLLQDIPTDELKDFNDQSKDIEDVMMTN